MIADNERLLLKIFHDYYVRNLSQNDIALRHLISRKKVQRFLEKGRNENLVEVKIKFPSRMYGELESELEDKYGLLEAMVSDGDEDEADSHSIMLRNVSELTSDYFIRVLTHDMTVSVTWSGHVAEMMDMAYRKVGTLREKPKNTRIVLTLGTIMGGEPDLETMEAARRLSDALGGELKILMGPGITISSDVHRALLSDPEIIRVIDMARRADVAYLGIGAMTGASRQLPVVERIMPDITKRLKKLGAVGDVNGHFFDGDGNPVPSELDDRLLGLNIPDIKAMPITVGIATGTAKHEAIKAALRGGIVKVLATDVTNARKLVAAK